MKKSGLFACAFLIVSVVPAIAGGGKPAPGQLENNWGEVTSREIQKGFGQGAHSSDPSGDGHGPGTADEPRAGLANVVERGNLAATTELIDSLTTDP